MLRTFGVLLAVGIAATVAIVICGWVEPIALVAVVPLAIGSVVCFVFARVQGSLAKDVARVSELAERGIRRRGRVRDAIPYASRSGGVAYQAGGALMVLRVQLEAGPGEVPEEVTVNVVEDSERARARIGTEVTVFVHPEDAALRALEGFRPNGSAQS